MESESDKRGSSSCSSSQIRREGLSAAASIKEGWQYMKASIIGLVKRLKARNEEEASKADMQAEKMQVEAADEAENTKKQLGK